MDGVSLLNVAMTLELPEATLSLICLKFKDGAGTLESVSAAREARLKVEGLEYLRQSRNGG